MRIMKRGIWRTIQGEGMWAGEPAVFLRLAGCDLRCAWCDTPASLPDFDVLSQRFLPVVTNKAEQLPTYQVRERVAAELALGYDHLVITGGEPVLQYTELTDLITELNGRKGFCPLITVETNTENIPDRDFGELINLASLSPKVYRWRESALVRKSIGYTAKFWGSEADHVQLKIVVSSLDEMEDAIAMIRELGNVCYPDWSAIQVESSALRAGLAKDIFNAGYVDRLSEHGIKLVAQMHPVLKLP